MIFFCYGTLMKGDCRNDHLDGSRFIGKARTSSEYTLYSNGSFPAMIAPSDETLATGVVGELYEVEERLLDKTLDAVEGRPYLYDRAAIKIDYVEAESPEDRDITDATTYIYQRSVDNLAHIGESWTVRGKN